MSEKFRARSPVSPGDVVGGKYRVEKVLGAGGMGVVVSAQHVDLGQSVALKFILPEALSGQGAVERFMREARAAVRLKSDHVARVYDVGRDDKDRPYMVLELLEGLDLAKLNRQRGPLPIADAVEYVLQACEALVEAHAAGIVHRDLKPQNLFVTRRLNGAPLVKVLDFGIAKAIGPAAVGQLALTDSQQVIGSPLYMAPEQMRSARTADARTDIWALGVILYELLGGQLPFEGETVTEVCIRVVNEEPKPLTSLRPGLDPSLVGVVMRCLAKEPDARWQNVAQLASALERFSRSAQQGGLVRPWRSFEDTQDSQERPRVVVPASSPDETGPSTAVTMPSAPPVLGHPPERHLVSTDVSWHQGSSAPARKSERPRSFAKGLAAGVVVSIAVAAAAAVMVVRASRPATDTAAAAQTPAVAPPPAPSPSPSPVVTTAEPASTVPTMTPAALPAASVTSAAAVPARPARTPARGSQAAATKVEPTATASAAAPATAKPAVEPVSPNGAPILR